MGLIGEDDRRIFSTKMDEKFFQDNFEIFKATNSIGFTYTLELKSKNRNENVTMHAKPSQIRTQLENPSLKEGTVLGIHDVIEENGVKEAVYKFRFEDGDCIAIKHGDLQDLRRTNPVFKNTVSDT